MKKWIAIVMAMVMVLSLAACSSETGGNENEGTENNVSNEGNNAASTGDTIKLVLWGAEEDQDLLKERVEAFKAAYPDYTFDIQIGVESEATAKDTILTDIEAAADVFAFADDQLVDLVNAGALASLNDLQDALQVAGKTLDDVKAANGAGSVTAASVGDTMYAFPMGGGNNYFLFYDSSVVSAEDVQSWDTLLAAANAAGKKVGMTLASGWYNASFFLGAGFTCVLNDDGTTTIDWNGTSASGITGVQVTQAMLEIAGNAAFQAIPDNGLAAEIPSGTLCAVVDGTWDASACQDVWGEGYAATKLPTFTVDGQQVQQGCFSGFKLMGVNAHSANSGWALLLAEFLTNEESQTLRFEQRGLAPTNTVAASNEAVAANLAIAASSAQDAFGVVQTVGNKYWDPAATFGEIIAQGQLSVSDEAGIQAALDTLVDGVGAAIE